MNTFYFPIVDDDGNSLDSTDVNFSLQFPKDILQSRLWWRNDQYT